MFHKELKIAYQHIGENETSLLLFHAFPLNKNMYKFIDYTLLETFAIVTLDLPGFGDSPLQEQEFTMKDYAEIGRDLMNDLGYSSYFVGGTSMGGYISFAFEKYFTKHSKGLILIDTKDEADNEIQRENRFKAIEELKQGKKHEYVSNLIPKLISPMNYKNQEMRDFIKELMLEAETEAIIQALYAMAYREDSSEVLKNLKKPGILIFGEYDTLTPITLGKKMHEKNLGLQFSLIPGSGHLTPIERPEIFTHVLASFFRYIKGNGYHK